MNSTDKDKIKKMKEESFISRINEIFEDPEVSREQHQMAEDIADTVDIEDLPW